MMASVNVDTLQFFQELESAGIEHAKAEKITKAAKNFVSQAFSSYEFATKTDLMVLEAQIVKTKQELQYFIVQTVVGSITVFGAYVTLLKYLG